MSKKLKILVTNDDGIEAPGLLRLVAAAAKLGDVWVAAPDSQCSGMSQKATFFEKITVKPERFPVDVKAAYRIGGTPTDCVKLGLRFMEPERPDFVFSGVNDGCNTGYDLAYSGTMGAAYEAALNGIPSIAFSAFLDSDWSVVDSYLLPIMHELVESALDRGEVWNVNFPQGSADAVKGILRDRRVAQQQLYCNWYTDELLPDGTQLAVPQGTIVGSEGVEEGTDIYAVLHGYISIGKVKNPLM